VTVTDVERGDITPDFVTATTQMVVVRPTGSPWTSALARLPGTIVPVHARHTGDVPTSAAMTGLPPSWAGGAQLTVTTSPRPTEAVTSSGADKAGAGGTWGLAVTAADAGPVPAVLVAATLQL
jgi:hypothetical protein